MSAARPTLLAQARGQRGFTIVELMVTIAIAMFLLGGLVTIVQNVRASYNQQQALVQQSSAQLGSATLQMPVTAAQASNTVVTAQQQQSEAAIGSHYGNGLEHLLRSYLHEGGNFLNGFLPRRDNFLQ